MKINQHDKLVSLDVESLFSNVPVLETMNVILKQVYNHATLAPPTITEHLLKQLLTTCTTETPFLFKNNTYLQTDGVSMGSPLGPTFADFYMANLENKAMNSNLFYIPSFYKRYVDDILAKLNN